MSSFIFLIIGLVFGSLTMFIGYNAALKDKDDIIDDLYKGIDIHNKREVRLIFINQSIKEYVKDMQKITKDKYGNATVKDATQEEVLAAGYYTAFKDVEIKIKDLEEEADRLQQNQNK